MTSKSAFIFVLFFPLTVGSYSSHAETYQWKDINGQTVVSDVPPPATVKGRRSIGGVKPGLISEAIPEKDPDAPKSAEPPQTIAEKNLEFKKRQQEAEQKAEKQAKERAAEKEKSENCDRARRNLAVLESSQPINAIGDNGERNAMDASQRAQEIERARKFLADTCH
jgi:type IV secretory pathway VirB10-like protein